MRFVVIGVVLLFVLVAANPEETPIHQAEQHEMALDQQHAAASKVAKAGAAAKPPVKGKPAPPKPPAKAKPAVKPPAAKPPAAKAPAVKLKPANNKPPAKVAANPKSAAKGKPVAVTKPAAKGKVAVVAKPAAVTKPGAVAKPAAKGKVAVVAKPAAKGKPVKVAKPVTPAAKPNPAPKPKAHKPKQLISKKAAAAPKVETPVATVENKQTEAPAAPAQTSNVCYTTINAQGRAKLDAYLPTKKHHKTSCRNRLTCFLGKHQLQRYLKATQKDTKCVCEPTAAAAGAEVKCQVKALVGLDLDGNPLHIYYNFDKQGKMGLREIKSATIVFKAEENNGQFVWGVSAAYPAQP